MSFPSYASYIPTKMSCCDRIPIDWKKLKLRRIIQLKSGEFITAEKIDSTGEYPVYGGNGLRGYTKEYTHVGEYVLVGRQGALCGNVNYAEGEFWASEHALVAHPLVRINTHWLGELLRSMNLGQYSLSAAQPGLSVERILDLEIPFPKFYEQQSIAAFLDYETAKIDALIAEQQRLIELLKEKRQAVISRAVTKGLNPNAPMKDSGVEWLGEVPAHWEVSPTKFLLDFLTSGSRGWAEHYADEGELFFRITNLTRDSIRPRLDSVQCVKPPAGSEGARAKIEVGDVLISITADLGSVCSADEQIEGGYVSQHVALARPLKSRCFGDWLAFFILGDAAKEQLLGSGYGGTKIQLSLEDVRDLIIALPSKDEQISICDELGRRVEKLDSMIGVVSKTVELLSERRSTLVSAAVTGKIDVRDWQPSESTSPKSVSQAAEETVTYG